jgi:hypothetical protein
MKQGVRRAIAHSLADSLASGCSFLLGNYEFSVRAHMRNGRLAIDCLAPCMIEGRDGPELQQVMGAMPGALAKLCAGQHIDPKSFGELIVAFEQDLLGMSATTRVAADGGETFVDTYVGTPLRRRRMLDHVGRSRTAR